MKNPIKLTMLTIVYVSTFSISALVIIVMSKMALA